MGRQLKNEFSWSKSRDETFRECLRRYYFQYYGSWGGWEKDAAPRTRQLYVLKNLQSRQMWAGSRVHAAIRHVLEHVRKGVPPPSAERVEEETLNAMREDFRNSRARKYREQPKKICGLFEHEYDVPVSDEEWKKNADNVRLCIRNFYASEIFKRLCTLPAADWLEVEDLASFQLDGLRVMVQLDASCKEDGRIAIYDWKTGRIEPGRADLQFACYVLYAMDKWKVEPSQVTAVEFNLPTSTEIRHDVSDEQLETAKDYIRESADEMLFPLADPEHNVAEEDGFDFTEDERACKRCNFVKVCPRWQGA